MPLPRTLTRDVLAQFLPNHEAIKAFEALINQVGVEIPDQILELITITVEALIGQANAQAAATEALALIGQLPDPIEVQQLRDTVAELTKRLECLEAIPPAQVGSVSSIVAGTGLSGGTITTSGTIAIADTIVAAGPIGDATHVSQITYNAQGQLTTVGSVLITPAVGDITGFGANVAAFLATPSSANLAAVVTDETGSGALVFATSPTLVTPFWATAGFGVRASQTATDRVSVTGATTIHSLTTTGSSVGASGALLHVNGYLIATPANSFTDLVLFIQGVAPVVVSSVNRGAPAARTYTASGASLQLAMAAGTYNVATLSLENAC